MTSTQTARLPKTEAVLKAYDRGVFDQENEELRCPMVREKVVIYLQILRPLYLQSLAFQSNNSTIADAFLPVE
jgi:hypothetical protein